nr:MAG TPA: hypothetical protein [Caudoviricetes sp.]
MCCKFFLHVFSFVLTVLIIAFLKMLVKCFLKLFLIYF